MEYLSSSVLIRPATSDADRALAVLDAQSWPPELWVVPPRAASESFFTSWRQPEDVVVAEIDGQVVGYARIGRHMRAASNEHVLHFDASYTLWTVTERTGAVARNG
jgi:hypothetical protein